MIGRGAASSAGTSLHDVGTVVLCAVVVLVFVCLPLCLVVASACGWWPFW